MYIFRCSCGFQAAKPVQIRRHQISSRCRGIDKIGIELIASHPPAQTKITEEIVVKVIGDGERSLAEMFSTYITETVGKNAVEQQLWIERDRGKKTWKLCYFDDNSFTSIQQRRKIVLKVAEMYKSFQHAIRDLGRSTNSVNSRLLSTLVGKLARTEALQLNYRTSVSILRQCVETRSCAPKEFLTVWQCTDCGFASVDRGNAFVHAKNQQHRIEGIESRFRVVSTEEIERVEIDRSSSAPNSISDHFHRAMYAIREGTLNWITHDVLASFSEYTRRYLAGGECPDRFRCIVRKDRYIYVFDKIWTKYRTWVRADLTKLVDIAFSNFHAFIVDIELRCNEIECPVAKQSVQGIGCELFTYVLDKNALNLHDLFLKSIYEDRKIS